MDTIAPPLASPSPAERERVGVRAFPGCAVAARPLTLVLSFKGGGTRFFIFLLTLLTPACAHTEVDPATVYRTASGFGFRVEVVAQKLEIPWALAFAPDGRIFITERPGRLRVIENGRLKPEPVAVVPEVLHLGEGGLMAIALDPGFTATHRLYLCHTARDASGAIINRVVRYRE